MKKSKIFPILLALVLTVSLFTAVAPLSAMAADETAGSMYISSCVANPGETISIQAPIFGDFVDSTRYWLEGAPQGVRIELSKNPIRNIYDINIYTSSNTPAGVYDVCVVFQHWGGSETPEEDVTQILNEPVSNTFQLRILSDQVSESFINVTPLWLDPYQAWQYEVKTRGIPDIAQGPNDPNPQVTLNNAPSGVIGCTLNTYGGAGMLEFTTNGSVQPGTYLISVTYNAGFVNLTSNDFLLIIPGGSSVISPPANIGPPLTQAGDRFASGLVEYEVTDLASRKVQAVGFSDNYYNAPVPESFDLAIPGYVNCGITPYKVTSIADWAFEYHPANTVTIGEGVASVGTGAFFNAFDCTSVSIPASVSSIGQYAFCSSWSLETLTVDPNNNWYKSVDDVLFSRDGKYLLCYPSTKTGESYIVPGTVTEIWSHAFSTSNSNKNGLKTITLPEGLTRIWDEGLACTTLQSVNLPASLAQIGTGGTAPLFGASSLETLTVADGNPYFKAVDNVLFSKDGGTLIYYPEGIKNENYTIPEGTEYLEAGAFIRQAIVPGYLKSVTLPESLTSASTMTFRFQTTLVSVSIPENLTEIGNQMFYNCSSLPSITLPSGIKKVGDYAFENCTALASVTSEAATAPALGSYAFYNVSNSKPLDKVVLYIPAGSLESYTTAGWTQYFSDVRYITSEEELSGDATLSALTVSPGTLAPNFSPNGTDYSVTVPNTVNSITIDATANDLQATVSGTGTKALNADTNSFDITVTAGNGTTKTYTVNVTREAAPPPIDNDAKFLQDRSAGILKNGLDQSNLLLNGKVLTLVIDGREFVLSTNANNRNISGDIALGNGYYLDFDIKGNGSNIKEFMIIQK